MGSEDKMRAASCRSTGSEKQIRAKRW